VKRERPLEIDLAVVTRSEAQHGSGVDGQKRRAFCKRLARPPHTSTLGLKEAKSTFATESDIGPLVNLQESR
jgi:hypothetical protein